MDERRGTKKLKYFQAFFGCNPSGIKEMVVVSPIIYPNRLGKMKVKKTLLGYLVSQSRRFTFIKTPMTQSAVADAVILLSKTPCKRVVFIGAIGGLAKGLKIGDLVQTKMAKDIYSVGSIHEETDQKLRALKKRGVVGIDFESRAFFAAAKKAGLSASAYYVVTDLPLIKPFYVGRTAAEKKRINDSIGKIVDIFRQ